VQDLTKTPKKDTELAQTETQEIVEPVEIVEIVEAAFIEEPVEIEEPTVEVTEKIVLQQAPVEEEIDLFSIEEKEAMKALADQGRLFDDIDEARMEKLVLDLTDWINKYAPTFGDSEAVLFEVTESLMVDDEVLSVEVESEVAETVETPTEEVFAVTFNFGDN